MKRVVLILTAAIFTTAFVACKDENKNSENSAVQSTTIEEDLALANPDKAIIEGDQFLYVTAPSGLTLREYGNLQSTKLARMPYGTKVKVLVAEENPTMDLGGIKGGMNQVEYNHKQGFAFNGYLSKYFPPELDISVKGYTEELQRFHPEVTYASETEGTASAPINIETITLPGAAWHEAFITAQRLFDFPKEFQFPNPQGKESETILDKNPKQGKWISQLEITRKDNTLEKIEYVYVSKKFDSTITIESHENGMRISRKEEVKQ